MNKGIADFTRGRERPRVITAAPHAPAAADGAVEAASDSPREALHAAAELYVPLHAGCAGHVRLAGAKAATPVELGIRLAARPAAHAA